MGFVASFSNGVDLSAPLHVALYLSQLASYIFLSSVSSYILLVACSLLCSIYIEMYLTGENPCFAVDRQQIHWFNEQQSPLPVPLSLAEEEKAKALASQISIKSEYS